jgi:molybdate transport system substrate-binding protein
MNATRLRRFILVALASSALLAAACGSSKSNDTSAQNTTATTAPSVTGSITVSAAASLTGAFTELGKSFQNAHPGTTITFNFGASSALVTQIQQGSAVDVFASADQANMDKLTSGGLIVGTPVVFARNQLEIVVKPGNPLGITSLSDLTKAKIVALCDSQVPCGSAADKALAANNVSLDASKVTRGQDVKATLAQVTTGDADAAVVYVTDALTVKDKTQQVPIAAAANVTNTYPIAIVKGTKNMALDQAWIAYVTGPTGQAVLKKAGFLPPA